MAERTLTDRLLGFWEEGWTYTAVKELAEAVEDTQQRTRQLEQVVYEGRPCPPRQQQENPT